MYRLPERLKSLVLSVMKKYFALTATTVFLLTVSFLGRLYPHKLSTLRLGLLCSVHMYICTYWWSR